jgi:hypothetical protein
MEVALAELRPATPITIGESESVAMLTFAPLPRTRPDGAMPTAAPLAVSAEDAIAALTADLDSQQWQQPSGSPAVQPVAYAPSPSQAEETRSADAAILAAFASLEGSEPANADELLAALERRTAAGTTPRSESSGAVFAATDLATVSTPAAEEEPPANAVPVYAGDADALREMIGAPVDQDQGQLGMPAPSGAAGLFDAPSSARAVAAVNEPAPAVHRFNVAELREYPADERSFLSKLFASLIE